MHFRVHTDTLVQALKLVQPGKARGSNYVEVHAQAGRVQLSTCNIYGNFQAFVASEVTEEGTQIVSYHQLLDTIKSLHSMITVKLEEKNLLVVSEGIYQQQASVKGEDIEKLPDSLCSIPVPGSTFDRVDHKVDTCPACKRELYQKTVQTYQILEYRLQSTTVSKKRLVQMFDQVAWLACPWAYGDLKWQTGICIELSHDIFSLFGMRRLGGGLANEPVNGTWKRSVLVDAEIFQQAIRAIRSLPKDAQVVLEAVFVQYQQTLINDEPVTDTAIGEWATLIHLSADNFKATLPLMSEKIPADYQQDFNCAFTTRVVCATANLRSAIEVISPAAAAHAHIVNLHIRDTKITVEVPNKQLPAISEIPLVTVEGPNVSIGVDASYLLSMLKKLPVSQVALEFGEYQPVLLRSCGTEVCVFRLATLAPTQQEES